MSVPIEPTPRFQPNFYGAVVLSEYITGLDGNQYVQLEGNIEILEGKSAIGFAIRDGQGANYGVRVAGKNTAWVFPGCKVRAVIAYAPGAVSKNSTCRMQVA